MNDKLQQLPSELEPLLAEVSLFGLDALSPDEQAKIEPWLTEVNEFEFLAAQLLEQSQAPAEDMPADFLSHVAVAVDEALDASALAVAAPRSEVATSAAVPQRTAGRSLWMPLLATAAALIIGVAIGRFWPQPQPLGVADLRAMGDTTVLDWTVNEDPASKGARGQVVWNERLDQGFMTFEGLAANDPRIEQYQLWVFDESRSAETPVDGGVFDIVESSGTVVVPIRTNLSVTKATLFAITVEQPGGVMVSKRERLPLLAQVE